MTETFWEKHGGKLIAGGIGLLIALAVFFWEKSNVEPTCKNMLRIASDSCFTSAVLVGGMGLLMWIDSNFGGFDPISYLLRVMIDKISPSKDKFSKRISYLEYMEKRREKGRSRHPGNTILIGCIFLGLSVLFVILFEMK